MAKVLGFKKASALAVAPTVVPKKIVTIFINAFCAVSDKRPTTPLSRRRLPNISIPIKGVASGKSKDTIIVTAIGKIIFSCLETGRSCSITTIRIFLVVKSRMMGGWIIGTNAI